MFHTAMARLAMTALVFGVAGLAEAQDYPLSLPEAVLLASEAEEPSVEVWQASAEALDSQGIADAALPDPMLRLGLANIRLSDFDRNREAMTQAQVSIRQMFPRGDTQRLSREIREWEARSARAAGALEARRIRLSVREAWLELYYWERAASLIAERRTALEQLGEIASASFAAGDRNSHDVIRIDLETRVLTTRLVEIERNRAVARADLGRYLGDQAATRALTPQWPILPPPGVLDAMRARLVRHPAIAILDARISARDRGVELAQQRYRPGFSLEAGYGLRESRSDLVSVGVGVELPLFSHSGQDAGVAAARSLREAEVLNRDAALLDLSRELVASDASLRQLTEHAALYRTEVLPRSRETEEAVLLAYGNERADFAELVRAELALLDNELALYRTQVDLLKIQARLMFLVGDPS
ncbi:TolC family protein [Maricaulis sp.]|uniref:TolC family protein n=1 Tax=Maricaulis sp. TaxID=1486257 RepID=UPI003A8F9785